MDRHAQSLHLAEELLGDVELQRLRPTELVLKASRLARLVGNEDLAAFLGYERSGYPVDGSANEWVTRAGRWFDDSREKLYTVPLSELDSMCDSTEREVEALKGGGNFSGDYAMVAARDHRDRLGQLGNRVSKLRAISGRVVTTVYEMVVETYYELQFSDLQETLFNATRTEIDSRLGPVAGSALDKIDKVAERLQDGDPESVSQAMNTCRRLIDAVADHLYPAQAEKAAVDGQPLSVGQNNVLNRLQAFAFESGAPKGRRDRLRRALSDVYDRSSAGMHAEIEVSEARFLFLQTYVVLGEMLAIETPRRD